MGTYRLTKTVETSERFDRPWLLVQLHEPRPYDLEDTDPRRYKGLDPRWQAWASVETQVKRLATGIIDALAVGDRTMGEIQARQ